MVKKLNKLIKFIKKTNDCKYLNQKLVNKEELIGKIGEVIDLHNEVIFEYKTNLKKYEDNEIKMKAKQETTDKMLSEYENKHFISEKEKVLIWINSE